MKSLYVLFQFDYRSNDELDYSSVYAKEFKFSEELQDSIKDCIKSYFRILLIENKERIWNRLTEGLDKSDLTYGKVAELCRLIDDNLFADCEYLSKIEYDEWKEMGFVDQPISYI